MRPVELVYARLDHHGCMPKGDPGSRRQIEARCPAHEDRNASLSLSEGEDDRALVKCFAGCSAQEIVHALGLGLGDLFPEKRDDAPRPKPTAPGKPVAWYEYHDEGGNRLFRVVRLEPKSFRQQRWQDGKWEWGLGTTRRVLYRLPQLKAALARNEIVFIVEGEKDVDALEAAGKTATTLPGGAGKWRDEYTALLAGPSHRIVVIGDDDDPDPKTGRREGHLHALAVERALHGRVGQVWARLPAEGFKDVADQLTAGVPFEGKTLRPIPTGKPSNGDSPENGGALMLTARAMAARPAPERALRVVGPMIQRGMRTTIGAQTGEGKTTLALQAIASLVRREPWLDETWVPAQPGRALIVDLEQGEETLKARLREAGLDNTDAVDVLWQPAGLALDSEAADQTLLYDTLRRGRYDLVVLDPLYQMHRGNANDERTAADLMRIVDTWSRELGFAVVIPMHARKPHPQAGKQFYIHDIAGSGGWNRNAEFVMGIQVMSAGASRLHWFKDRIGQGPDIGSFWWLDFSRESGFKRTHKEDRDALRRSLNEMLAAAEGVTEATLISAGADEVWMKGMRKRCHLNGDRWRATPWHEQTTLSTDGMT